MTYDAAMLARLDSGMNKFWMTEYIDKNEQTNHFKFEILQLSFFLVFDVWKREEKNT